MVLRGSNVRPESVGVALKNVEEAQEAYAEADARLAAETHEVSEALDRIERSPPKYDVLLAEIHKLNERVQQLESEKREAEASVLKSNAALVRSVKQFACGGLAGATARTTVAPIDRVKILMQTQHITQAGATKYTGVAQTLRTIIAEEGLKKLWRGNGTNCIRVVPYSATQFASYDFYKSIFVDPNADKGALSIPQRLASGALAGATATTVTHPLDVIRLRLAVQPELRGALDAARSVWMENGVRSLYKGYVPTLVSLSPFIAVNFGTFDTLKTHFQPDQYAGGKRSAMILGLGASAGLIAQSFCYPLDTVRRRMQLAGTNYASTVDAFHTIFKQEGMIGFYKGMLPNAIKIVPNNAIRFLAFDMLCSMFNVEKRSK